MPHLDMRLPKWGTRRVRRISESWSHDGLPPPEPHVTELVRTPSAVPIAENLNEENGQQRLILAGRHECRRIAAAIAAPSCSTVGLASVAL
jgi:hypothetical protein